MKDFLNGIPPYTYDYADPAMGQGTRAGVMAQDLEQAGPVGQSMVQTAPNGMKMVDTGQAALASLAALSHLNKRIQDIEAVNPGIQELKRTRGLMSQYGAENDRMRKASLESEAQNTGPDLSAWERFRQ